MDTTQPVDITPDPFGANCPNGADCTQHPHGHHRKHTTITAPDLLAEADQHLEAALAENPNHAPGAGPGSSPRAQDVPVQMLRELLIATGAFSDAAADRICQAYQDERAAEFSRLTAIVHGYRRVVATSGLRRLVGAATTLERSLRGLTLPREVAAYLEQLREVLKATKVPDPEAAQEYLIWSHHHQMWFAPKASGYRRDITDAGRFTLAETAKWLDRGCKCCMVPEVAIPAPANEVFATPGAASKWAIEEIQRSTRARVELGVVNRWAGRSTSERGA